MSIRTQRINSELQKALSEIVRDIRDPRVTEMVSVMSVDTAPDLKTAKVYISIYGDKIKVDSTFEGIIASSGFIKTQLRKSLRQMKYIPELHFIKDGTLEYADKINKLFETIAADKSN